MAEETNLDAVLRTMSARLADGLFVFVTAPDGSIPSGLHPRMMFHEAEGTTLIIQKEEADVRGWPYEFPCRMITLHVHSSLKDVGFLSRITAALAEHGVAVNPVFGFNHDYLFVPDGRELEALAVLQDSAGGPE
jgi:hypothetical protein